MKRYFKYFFLLLLTNFYFVIYNINTNKIKNIGYKDLNLLSYIFITFFILFNIAFVLKYKKKLALKYLFTTMYLVYFFSFFKYSIKLLGDLISSNYNIKYPFYFLLLISLFYVTNVIIKKVDGNKIYNILSISLIVLILLSLKQLNSNEDKSILNQNKFIQIQNLNKFNYIFIIFDAYTSSNVLQNKFGFNNKILQDIQSYKFHEIPNSKSSYLYTIYTMSQILNIDVNSKKYDQKDIGGKIEMIYNSKLVNFFKKNGYKTYNLSFLDINNTKRNEDIKKLIGMEVNFNKNELLISSSIFIQIKSTINFFILRNIFNISLFKKYTDDIIEDHRSSIKTNLKLIDSVVNNETMPFFLYSHFVLPHDPYCFNKNGTLNKTQKDYFNPIDSNYIKNLLYANVIIDSIAKSFYNSNKTKNTIIIIQGDHGARVENIKLNDNEKRGVLNLIYLPDLNYTIFHDSTSNLNTHIKILNKYFNQNIKESNSKNL